MSELLRDLSHGARTLMRQRGFTLVAVLTLAVGIGASSTLLSVVRSVLLRPFSYAEEERLVLVWESLPPAGYDQLFVSAPDFVDFRRQARSLEELAAFRFAAPTLTGAGEPVQLEALEVTANLLPLLGARSMLGRTFTAEEERPGGGRVVVLGHGLWRRSFEADPGIVGRTVLLDGSPATVIGVLAAGFQFPPPITVSGQTFSVEGGAEVFLPLPVSDPALGRQARSLIVVGRLAPGATPRQAGQELALIAGRLAESYPEEAPAGLTAFAVPLHEQAVQAIRPVILILLVAVGLVLLIACANVANLLLARAAGRESEVALRTALGASRLRIVRQLLSEGLVLGLGGGALGALLAYWAVKALSRLELEGIPRLGEIRLDAAVLGLTLVLSLMTSLLFGAAPALHLARVRLSGGINELGKGGTRSSGRLLLQKLFVIFELALSLTLLAAAALLLQSFWRLQRIDPGFDPEGLISVNLVLPAHRYQEADHIQSTLGEIFHRVSALPGVEAAGATSALPLSPMMDGVRYRVEGEPPPAEGEMQVATRQVITPGYLEALGVRVLQGRSLTAADDAQASPVVLVNETLARRHWPSQSPVGRRMAVGKKALEENRWSTIAGVVEDVRLKGLTSEVEPTVYHPFSQNPGRAMMVVLKTDLPQAAAFRSLRQAIWSVDPDLPLDPEPLAERISRAVARPRLSALFLTLLAGIALFLGAVGVYGVMTYVVAQRRQEIAIRVALGARLDQVLGMILRFGLRLALAGIGIGLLGALAVGKVMAGLLYETGATDPWTLAAVSVLLAIVTLGSAYVPARRAARMQPTASLRTE